MTSCPVFTEFFISAQIGTSCKISIGGKKNTLIIVFIWFLFSFCKYFNTCSLLKIHICDWDLLHGQFHEKICSRVFVILGLRAPVAAVTRFVLKSCFRSEDKSHQGILSAQHDSCSSSNLRKKKEIKSDASQRITLWCVMKVWCSDSLLLNSSH